MSSVFRTLLAGLIVALAVLPMRGYTQEPASLSKEEIEQLVAPISLYPDALVAQVLILESHQVSTGQL